jgi:hypothetical protein
MKTAGILVLAVMLAVTPALVGGAADEKKELLNIRSQEVIGKIVGINLENSTIELEYESDEQAQKKQVDTFYITEATTIDVATVKSTIKDLTVGANILLEYAQMPDGAKVVESVWVKKS